MICPIVRIAENDGRENEENAHDDQLDHPEGNEDTLEPHFRGGHVVVISCCCGIGSGGLVVGWWDVAVVVAFAAAVWLVWQKSRRCSFGNIVDCRDMAFQTQTG